jgi:hypothetical protein
VVPNFLVHTVAKFGNLSPSFDTILTWIYLETQPCDTATLATRQLSLHSPNRSTSTHKRQSSVGRANLVQWSCPNTRRSPSYEHLNSGRSKEPRARRRVRPAVCGLATAARAPRVVAPPRASAPRPRLWMPPEALAVCTRGPRASPEIEITGVSRGKQAPPPAIFARAWPLWPAPSVHPQPRPSPWTASPWSREASPSLSRGIASPERQIHPRRISVARRRTWAEQSAESFSNSLYHCPSWPLAKLSDWFTWTIAPWAGRIPRRRRAYPPAHMDRPTPTIPDGDPHIALTLGTSPTFSTTSPEQSRRR